MVFRKYTISATSLKTYATCPRQAKFKYIDKAPEKDLNGRNFVVGSAMHDMIHAWATGVSRLSAVPRELRQFNEYTPGWMPKVASYYLEEAIKKQKVFYYLTLKESTLHEYGPAQDDHGYLLNKLIRACRVAEQIANVLEFQKRKVETEFKVDMPYKHHKDFKFFGFVDVIDRTRNIIFDWKASKDSSWAEEEQIVLYAWLYKMMTGENIELAGWLFPLKTSGPMTETIKITQDMFTKLETNIETYVQAFVDQDFPIAPVKDSVCNQCPYKSICPKFSNDLLSNLL